MTSKINMDVYILCTSIKKPNVPKSSYFIKQIDDSLFKRLAFNEIHKKFCVQVTRKQLFGSFIVKSKKNANAKDDDLVNVILMPELDEKTLRVYLNTYNDEPDNIHKYAEYLAIISYNQVNPNRYQVKKYFQRLLEEQSSFWEDDYNCNITLNDIFIKRKFNYDVFSKKEFNKIGNKIMAERLKNIKESELNYLNELDRFQDKETLFKPGNNYWLGKQTNFTNSDFVELYKQIPTEYLRYNFICNIICSRSHCHLILNNIEMLKLIQPMLEKYKVVFKYILGYGWLTLRQEEITMRNKLKDTDRIIFDIDTVNELPIYPFGLDDINQNPYACILLDNELMNLKENCVSMEMIKTNYSKYYGLPTKEVFKKRLNIFVNGKNEPGILDKMDWSNLAITGSAMTACAMKYNPLIDICKQSNGHDLTDGDFQTYLFHYYNNSDIDLVCTETTMKGYLDKVNKFANLLQTESIDKINFSNVHTASIIISDEFINNEIDGLKEHLKNNSINLGWVKANLNNLEVKKYYYNKFYIVWKEEQTIDTLTKHPEYLANYVHSEYLKQIPVEDFRIYLMDYEIDGEVYKKTDYEKYTYNPRGILTSKIVESIRFQLKSAKLNRSWEIFKSHNENIFSTVGRFHMGFVRACWNGKTLLCLPSFISAMMLQMSTDYKYFASIRDPIEIINKYRSRGFGIILNDKEKIHMAYYNSIKPEEGENKWCEMYNVNIKNKASIKSIFGPKKLNDNIFKPSKYFEGMPDDCFKPVDYPNYTNTKEAFQSMYSEELNDFYKYKCITNKGRVYPLNRDVIKKGYEIINKIE